MDSNEQLNRDLARLERALRTLTITVCICGPIIVIGAIARLVLALVGH